MGIHWVYDPQELIRLKSSRKDGVSRLFIYIFLFFIVFYFYFIFYFLFLLYYYYFFFKSLEFRWEYDLQEVMRLKSSRKDRMRSSIYYILFFIISIIFYF